MLQPQRIVAPSGEILTVSDAKEHLRVTVSDEDDLILGYIRAIEAHLDGYSGILGRALINQTWRAEWNAWQECRQVLPLPDVSSATIKYFDVNNALQDVSSQQFRVIQTALGSAVEWDQSFTAPSLYARSDAVRIEMVCGYGADASFIPKDIVHAAKLYLGAFYENRENTVIGTIVSELPSSLSIDALLFKHRRTGL